jgi:uncharacterized membrane protein YoaK (UPF0700 family)
VDTRPRQQIVTLILIVLTFGSGATDVAAFSRLGGVFTSVMTGNIVFWGLAAAERSVSLASHSAVSIAGYVTGVACGTWVAHGFKIRGDGEPVRADRAGVLPAHVRWALFTELILLAGLAAGWEATGARPTGWAEFALLAVTAAAMGVQSTSVNELGLSNVSTTFLTGTLTGLVSVLIGLAAGAGLSGLLLATAPRAVPVLPLAAMIAALALSAVPLSNGDGERPGR